MRRHPVLVAVPALMLAGGIRAGNAVPGATANNHPVYTALRTVGIGDGYQVDDLVLNRDAATFALTGSVYLLSPVQGRSTGAVFIGEGTMAYTPPLEVERGMLRNLTKGEAFAETFQRAVFRFSDDTADLITAAARGPSTSGRSQAEELLKDVNDALRLKLRDNLHARIFHDVLSPAPGRLFHAYITGRKYSNRLVYMMDPQGAGFVAPEEVQLRSWADKREGIFAAHHYSEFYTNSQRPATAPGTWVDIEHQKLDTSIEGNGELTGDATTTFVSLIDGLSAVPLALFPTLRVSGVMAADGTPLGWIQESKNEDGDFWVVLPTPLARGERFTLRTVYKGRDAVLAEGNDNYFPVARSNWYPNNTGIKDYATYELTFSVPRRLQLVGSGDFVDETVQGDRAVSRWTAEYPLSVAGFNLGLFKRDEGTAGGVTVVALANVQPSNSTTEMLRLAEMLNMPVGSLVTTGANRKALSEAQIALQVFTDYFGPLSLTRVYITQQTACNFGQAWPGVIYIPTCYYWSPAVRHQIGMQQTNPGYWDSVAAHEVAHLWWGHALGWDSYRDQWMSEGFSNLSASIFLQTAYPKEPQRFREFWRGMLDSLVEKNAAGVRPIDVGPVTQGFRLSSDWTGGAADAVLYAKGAYILHMLRMMIWTHEEADGKFKAMLRDFVGTHRNRPVSTADFRAIVEKHMVPGMDVEGNGSMNCFFRQYVEGTSLPTYRFQHSVSKRDGQAVLAVRISQSDVHESFVMPVPLYVELEDGRIIRLGSVTLRGNTTIEQSIPLGLLPVKRAMLNYYYDVQAREER